MKIDIVLTWMVVQEFQGLKISNNEQTNIDQGYEAESTLVRKGGFIIYQIYLLIYFLVFIVCFPPYDGILEVNNDLRTKTRGV